MPYNLLSNVLIMYTAASLCPYYTFATTFEALEANFFQQEKVLQFPRHRRTINESKLVPEEFAVEKNVNYRKEVLASEEANADNKSKII